MMTVNCNLLIFVDKRKSVSEVWFSDDENDQNSNIFIIENKIFTV